MTQPGLQSVLSPLITTGGDAPLVFLVCNLVPVDEEAVDLGWRGSSVGYPRVTQSG